MALSFDINKARGNKLEMHDGRRKKETTTKLYQSLHSPVVEIVGIIAKRIVELNGHQLQPHKAVREQEDDKTVR